MKLIQSKNLTTCNFLFLTQIYRWVIHQFIYKPAYSDALSIALLMLKKILLTKSNIIHQKVTSFILNVSKHAPKLMRLNFQCFSVCLNVKMFIKYAKAYKYRQGTYQAQPQSKNLNINKNYSGALYLLVNMILRTQIIIS